MTTTKKITFLQAIARQEGFYHSGTLAQRRNNPGNIEEGKFAQSHGALPSDGNRFAKWPTPEAGFAAMSVLLRSAYLNISVSAAINKWAPGIENDTDTYITDLCEWTGLTPDSILTGADVTVV